MPLERHVSSLPSSVSRSFSISAVHRIPARICRRSARHSPSQRALYSTAGSPQENEQPSHIVVIGGGISGLSSAYWASKEFPNTKITVYEGKDRLGGWIQSTRKGDVLFESGPRTLRTNAAAAASTLQLIQELGLKDQILTTPKDSPAAHNRYLYYPDRLQRLPGPGGNPWQLISFMRSGLLAGFGSVFNEINKPRNERLEDESIGNFIARRLDRRIADNIVSGIIHGIYAGDVWQLSIKSLMPMFWEAERAYGSLTNAFWALNKDRPMEDVNKLAHPFDLEQLETFKRGHELDRAWVEEINRASTFTFRDGLETLTKALETELRGNPNVSIQMNTWVHHVTTTKDGKEVEFTEQPAVPGDGMPVAPFPADLENSVAPPGKRVTADSLIWTQLPGCWTVPVHTVSLWYPNPNLLPVQGFGYLIPQSVPFMQNPERALGVIFDSDAVQGQDTAVGTKVTVMLGGHYWSEWTSLPDSEECVAMARSVLERHLGIKDTPALAHDTAYPNSIPQYLVGHARWLNEQHDFMLDRFKGKVRMVGCAIDGVGVNDCVWGAWHLVRGMRGSGWRQRLTGLEKHADTRPWEVARVHGPGLWDENVSRKRSGA